MGDLIARVHCLMDEHRTVIWNLVGEWASGQASDKDRAWLREKIRVSVMSRRAVARNGRREADDKLATRAKAAYEALTPRDLLNRYEWLFRDSYVDESADELHDDARDYEKREERIAKLRPMPCNQSCSRAASMEFWIWRRWGRRPISLAGL